MDLHLFLFWLLTAPFTTLTRAAPVSDTFTVMVTPSVSVRSDQSTTLPCWLNPSQSAENMEILWYRKNFDDHIMFYSGNTKKADVKSPSYMGRVSFGLKDEGSVGLEDGDVSLKLVNVTLADAGEYTCYVSSEQGYDSGIVQLNVTQFGTWPLLTITDGQGSLINVSCESEGWYPQPQLRWSNQMKDVIPEGLMYPKEDSGLVSVRSWIQVSRSASVSCSVGLAGEEAKQGTLHWHFKTIPVPPGPLIAGWVLFGLLIVILGVLAFKYRDLIFRRKSKLMNHDAADREKLLPHAPPTAFAEVTKYYVNIELEDTNNKFLTIRGNILRDSADIVPSHPCATAARGKLGFSSGKHYWEVSLCLAVSNGTCTKESWWVGVTSRSANLQDCDLPSAANGFWFLSSRRDKPGTLQFSTNPAVSVMVQSRPKTVGVFLNYDGGELSFYDVEKEILIATFTEQFRDEVFPLFNPGKGDKEPMKVIQKSTEAQPTANSAPQHTE